MSLIIDKQALIEETRKRARAVHDAIAREVRQSDGSAFEDSIVDTAVATAMHEVANDDGDPTKDIDGYFVRVDTMARELVRCNGPVMMQMLAWAQKRKGAG